MTEFYCKYSKLFYRCSAFDKLTTQHKCLFYSSNYKGKEKGRCYHLGHNLEDNCTCLDAHLKVILDDQKDTKCQIENT